VNRRLLAAAHSHQAYLQIGSWKIHGFAAQALVVGVVVLIAWELVARKSKKGRGRRPTRRR
jgi:hypothetical protein